MKVEDLLSSLFSRYGASAPAGTKAANLSIQEHVGFIWNKEDVQNTKLEPPHSGRKSAASSKQFRSEGNDAYMKADYRTALTLYTKAILHAPQSEIETELEPLSLAYGNRSAVLYRAKNYSDCLEDIELAFNSGCPKDKKLKLLERQTACIVAMGGSSLKAKPHFQPVPQIVNGVSSDSATLSGAVELQVRERKGRHYIAKRDIEPGEVILVEKPFVHNLSPENYLSHCRNCVKRCLIMKPCRACSLIGYCGAECETEAWQSFHRYECQVLPFVDALHEYCAIMFGRDTVTAGLALVLGIVLKTGFQEYYEKFLDDGGKLQIDSKLDIKAGSSFLNFDNLMWRDASRSVTVVNAIICLKILQATSFFGENPIQNEDNSLGDQLSEKMAVQDEKSNKSPSSLSREEMREFETYLGATMHWYYLICRLNTMQIAESELGVLPHETETNLHGFRNVHIGAGVLVQGNLFNHSCYSNVKRCFHGTSGVFRALRSIAKGDELTIAYGLLYHTASRAQRQQKLKNDFGFDCQCTPCAENWPQQHERFQIACPGCRTLLPLDVDSCRRCHRKQPGQRGREVLGNATSSLFMAAAGQFQETGKVADNLLDLTVAHLKDLEAHFVAPCEAFTSAISVMEGCFNAQGNCYDVPRVK